MISILTDPTSQVVTGRRREAKDILYQVVLKPKIFFQGCSKHSKRFVGFETCFLLVTVRFCLFLVDKLRRKHPFKHANKKKSREDCSKHSCVQIFPNTF